MSLMPQRLAQEVLEDDAAVARFVRMLPARSVLVPILKRFFEMELHRIDKLVFVTLDHHLIAA